MAGISTQIREGISAYGKSLSFIKKNGMMKYFVVPIIINIVLVVLIAFGVDNLSDWVKGLLSDFVAKHENFAFLQGATTTVILSILFFTLFIFFGGSLIIAFMSPIYSTISEKTDTIITGRTFEFSSSQLVKDIIRGIAIALRNTFFQILWSILCFIIGLIPLIGWIVSPVLLFCVEAYYFGFQFMDYTNERLRLKTKASMKSVLNQKWLAITIGSVYALSFYVFCGSFLAVFIGGISTVAATMAQIKLENN